MRDDEESRKGLILEIRDSPITGARWTASESRNRTSPASGDQNDSITGFFHDAINPLWK